MESIACAFDQPLDSESHQALRRDAWLGGEEVVVRYWLGRLRPRNFFREPIDAVRESLRNCFLERGCVKGASLVSHHQSWSSIAQILQHDGELSEQVAPTQNPRRVAALVAVMENPEASDSELAKAAKTTEKQICRMPDVFVLRKIWRQRKPR